MALLELLVLKLTPVIAKNLVKIAIGNSGLLTDASGAIIDLAHTEVNTWLADREAKQRIERLSRQAVESLAPLLDAEASREDVASEAVVLAVIDSLESAPLDVAQLLAHNLDPEALARHMLDAARERVSTFSLAEQALFDRLIRTVCHRICRIASELPSFTEQMDAAVLSRLDTLQQSSDRIHRWLELEKDEPARFFEDTYRSAVVTRLDQMELFGATTSDDIKGHRISVAYVRLAVKLKHAASMQRETEPVPVERALAGSKRLLIRGAPGSGKTTLLKWVAVRAAQQAFDGALFEWNGLVPFHLPLRAFIEAGGQEFRLPVREAFVAQTAPNVAGEAPAAWVHRILRGGRAVVLVDGVDEVPRALRDEFREWLQDLIHSFPESAYIVTTRPYALPSDWAINQGFDEAELQDLSLQDIDTLVHLWHKAVAERVRDRARRELLPALEDHLKLTIRAKQSIRRLASTPLLCALICALHRDRSEVLPHDRIQLYEACLAMLLVQVQR